MNTTFPSHSTRLVRMLWPPRANPLARGVDRLESVSLTVVVLVALFLLPVVLVLGSLVYADLVAKGEQQAAASHETVATLLADAPPPSTDGHGYSTSAKSSVRARWEMPDGSARTGLVKAARGLDAGTEVTIWLDNRDGHVVDQPTTSAEASGASLLTVVFTYLALVSMLAIVQFGLHRLFDRRRLRAWSEEWARVEPDWNNYRRT